MCHKIFGKTRGFLDLVSMRWGDSLGSLPRDHLQREGAFGGIQSLGMECTCSAIVKKIDETKSGGIVERALAKTWRALIITLE
jgi:hypothetical protein